MPRRIVILEEVKTFLVDFPDGLLLNILPAELHARVHIPGSKQACVFERAFPEHMEKLAPDPATPILVYGAGASLDAAVATAKLLGLGYLNVRMWPGGLKPGVQRASLSKENSRTRLLRKTAFRRTAVTNFFPWKEIYAGRDAAATQAITDTSSSNPDVCS